MRVILSSSEHICDSKKDESLGNITLYWDTFMLNELLAEVILCKQIYRKKWEKYKIVLRLLYEVCLLLHGALFVLVDCAVGLTFGEGKPGLKLRWGNSLYKSILVKLKLLINIKQA